MEHQPADALEKEHSYPCCIRSHPCSTLDPQTCSVHGGEGQCLPHRHLFVGVRIVDQRVPVVMRCIARKQDTLAAGKPALAQHDAFQKINGPVGDWNSLRRRFDTLIIIAGQRRTARLRGGSLDRCSSLRRKVPRPRPLSDRDPTLRKNVVMFPASSADSVGAINRFPSSSPPRAAMVPPVCLPARLHSALVVVVVRDFELHHLALLRRCRGRWSDVGDRLRVSTVVRDGTSG